ncbi:hypothetical protein C6A85_37280, partial [Mycobacterium sp. ITM-2017-0098]
MAARIDDLRACPVLWTVTDYDPDAAADEQGAGLDPGTRLAGVPAHLIPAELGFCVVERVQFNQTQVVRSVL